MVTDIAASARRMTPQSTEENSRPAGPRSNDVSSKIDQHAPSCSDADATAATSNMKAEDNDRSNSGPKGDIEAQGISNVVSKARAAYLLFRQDFTKDSQTADSVNDENGNSGDAAAAVWKHLSEEQRRPWENKVEEQITDVQARNRHDGNGDVEMGEEVPGNGESDVASGKGEEPASRNQRAPRTVEESRYDFLGTLIAQGLAGDELERRMSEWEQAQRTSGSSTGTPAAPAPAPPTLQSSYDFGYSRASIYPTSDSRTTERGDPQIEQAQRSSSPGAPAPSSSPPGYNASRTHNYAGPEGGFVPPGGFALPQGFSAPPPGYTYYSSLLGTAPPQAGQPPPITPVPATAGGGARLKSARGAAKTRKIAEGNNESDDDVSGYTEDDIVQDGADVGQNDDNIKPKPKPKLTGKGKRKTDGPSSASKKKQKKNEGDPAEAPPAPAPVAAAENASELPAAAAAGPSYVPPEESDPSSTKTSTNPRVKNKWACDYCSASFTRKYDRQRHLDSQICKTRSGNAMATATHLTTADALPDATSSVVVAMPPPPTERDVERTCAKCGHIFARRDAYLRHKNSEFNCETWKGTKGRKGRGRPTKNGSMAPHQLAAAAAAAGITLDQGSMAPGPSGSPAPPPPPPPEAGPPPVGQPLMFANPMLPQHMQMMMMPPGMQPPPGMPPPPAGAMGMLPYGPPPGMYAPVMYMPPYQYMPPPPNEQHANGQQPPHHPANGQQPLAANGQPSPPAANGQQQPVDPALHALDPALLEAVAKALAANPATAAAVAAGQQHLLAAATAAAAAGAPAANDGPSTSTAPSASSAPSTSTVPSTSTASSTSTAPPVGTAPSTSTAVDNTKGSGGAGEEQSNAQADKASSADATMEDVPPAEGGQSSA
ncbi:hypothetical protein BD626DRAFT_634325 [Schizophyllum amplum]|uniref:Uncharacterized protein n=1 Tax=Schizophyllum amplum TaxID=97359 RepID=A0A550BZW1_9AGAR|nr:hypothetical protein BD626DRAFT_634325 [Auriculariopsis ampla]